MPDAHKPPAARADALALLDPSAAEVGRHLAGLNAAASAYEFMPRGGERLGGLGIAHLPAGAVRDFREAAVTLWKIAACLCEEWTYEAWTAEHASIVAAGSYRDDWERWTSAEVRRPTVADIDSIRDAARNVITAEPPWLNPPWYSPRREAFPEAVLGLEFMRRDKLLVCLCDEWNDEVLLFRDADALLLVQWWTTA
ncbi:MAG: hypothetical protein AAF721_36645 [Myxococcota bacterium]